ncbi:hypothetical protein I3842_04G079200 [Carya illinoinensis]|uniref:Endonuclease/exonuclease/phosphatase domain-containing protein n=1 Tax=Carya illinoinensis TaxID=32201 RepID=A0A922FA82_CARIL|nr:hypothetical protein I3842_04G079200 [Carya illinoinensis]
MWDQRVVEKMEVAVGLFTVACSFRSVSDGFKWAFAGVYGPNIDRDRRLLWDELVGLHSWWDLPWCIGGDFNAIRFTSECFGNRRMRPAMSEFSECIFELNLVDLPLAGGLYTWANNQTWSRLDRFLISPEWEIHFPEVWQKRLSRLCSDHWPIMLDCGGIQRRRQHFKFENMWLKSEGFVDRVGQWWSLYQIQGTPSFIFAGKLKTLKQDLKLWNLQSFGNVGELKKIKLREIQDLEMVQESRPLNPEEVAQKLALVVELERLILLEEISWRQKSRALWLKEGDRSTKFFHRVANSHRRSNNIEMLKIDGAECRDERVINNHMVHFFEQLLTEQEGWRPKLKGMAFESIGPMDVSRMERPFEEAEILEVVRKMTKDKAPGPDGFSMGFFQTCWEILKDDLMKVFQEFHSYGKFEKA